MLAFRRKDKYGLQILDDQIRIVAIRPSSRTVAMKHWHSEALPLGAIENGTIVREETVAEVITHVVKELGIRGADVHLSVPTSSTVLRKTSYPIMKDKELRSMIDVELSGGSQIPFKDPVFDFVRLGRTADAEEEVLIFASPAQVVESYVRVVRQAGLKPLSVELSSLASLRLLQLYSDWNKVPLPGCFIVIHAERSHLDLSIVVAGIPVFLHSVQGVSTEEAYAKTVAAELSRMLYYFSYAISANQEEIQTIYLLGAEERLKDLPLMVQAMYEGPVHTLSLHTWIKEPLESVHAYAIPIGLALRGA